jgi:transposase-like protein
VQRPPVELSELDRARVSAVARRHGIR